MERTRRVVVGIDGSEASLEALAVARHEARGRGLPLEVVMAWDWLDQPPVDGKQAFDPQFTQERAEEHLAGLLAGVDGERGPALRPRAVCGHPAEVLLGAATDAELLVVGSRGTGGFLGLRLGSVSEKVVRHAPVPVMVVPPGTPAGTEGAVVVGVDGSTAAQRALRWALGEAAWRDAPVHLVHAWMPPATVTGPFGGALAATDAFGAAAAQDLEADLARARAEAPHLAIEGSAPCEGPAQALLAAGADAALLVVGSRGRGGFAGLLLGSVSHQVVHHAPCPVVVVPDPPAT